MITKRGVYGPDDVAWEVQEARDNAAEELYRKNKEEVDARDRLSIKRDLLARKYEDSWAYQDKDNVLYLGYERNGNVYIFARLDISRKLVRFIPLEAAAGWVVRWTPVSKLDIWSWNMTAPKGCV